MAKARIANSTIKFSEIPEVIKRAAPMLGAHTEEKLLNLGYSWEDMAVLKGQKVIP